MARQIDLLIYYPQVIKDIKEFQELAKAENPEINELWLVLERLMKDQFVHEATETGIRRWEKILKINPSASSTLEERRWEILNRLNIKIPYTWTMLKNKLAGLYGDDFTMKYVIDTCTLKIRIKTDSVKNLDSTRNMLDVIVPANLYVDLGMME